MSGEPAQSGLPGHVARPRLGSEGGSAALLRGRPQSLGVSPVAATGEPAGHERRLPFSGICPSPALETGPVSGASGLRLKEQNGRQLRVPSGGSGCLCLLWAGPPASRSDSRASHVPARAAEEGAPSGRPWDGARPSRRAGLPSTVPAHGPAPTARLPLQPPRLDQEGLGGSPHWPRASGRAVDSAEQPPEAALGPGAGVAALARGGLGGPRATLQS